MNLFRFVYSGQPLPKQRHRTGKGFNTYTPTKTRVYEKRIKDIAKAQMQDAERTPFVGDLALIVVFRRKTFVRADEDNLLKALKDAFNKTVWGDDSQVVFCAMQLYRGCDNPGIEAYVLPFDELNFPIDALIDHIKLAI